MKSERGFALIVTLLVTALLVAVVTEFIREVYVEATLQRSFRDGSQASLMAESGIMGGTRLIQSVLANQSYSSLNDAWKTKPLHMEDERGVIDVVIDEESGKLNLNVIAPPSDAGIYYFGVLTRLLKRLELTQDLADPLADWIDKDDEPHRSGAESPSYSRLAPPYASRNGWLLTMEELRLVKDFDDKSFAKLRPFVTIYPDDAARASAIQAAPVNINTAAPEVLASLDERMNDELAKRIVEYRKNEPFKSTADLAKVSGMQPISMTLNSKAVITVKGAVYRITATARIGETARTIEAVARMGGSKPEFLYWREY